ncbi:pseudouridine synthase, partial [Crenobacter intestini]|uniref:pseudouridine synthase n=1 Tax=Crenobacter intestini TaxID=2563443 RepID=UPI001F3205B7
NKPYGRSEGGRSDKPRFGENKPYGRSEGGRDDNRRFGENKPYGRNEGGRDDNRRFGENKPYGRSEGGRDDKPRFGENKPYGRSEGGRGEQPRFGEGKTYANRDERRQGGSPKVIKAKKLQVRAPSSKILDKSQRLRETRVDLDQLEPVRLQKALAASGAGSRREVEELIEAGLITVNGKVAELGDRVGPQDRVMVKGHPVKLKWADRLPRIIMYHKQEGEIVSRADPEGRVTVFDRLPQAKSSRWVAIGRLDINTSGLLLMTTSGELANRMMHPSFEMEREYSVRVLGELTPEIMKEMVAGVQLEDGPAQFLRVYQSGGVDDDKANKWVNVVIKEGRNREVRRMFEHFGLTVSRLIRIRFGNIGLPGRLKRGQFYELNEAEVAAVMKWAGLTSTGQVRRG